MKNTYNILLTRDRSAFSTKWVCNFASNLSNAGHNVTLLCDSHEKKVDAPISEKVNKINLSEYSQNCFINIWHAVRHWFTIPSFRFSKAIKKIKPDIIICYFLQDLLNVTLFQKHNIPIILMMHNPPDEVFAKHLKHWWKRKLFHHLIKQVDVIQVLMPEFVDLVKNEFPQKQVVVIPNQVIIPKLQKNYNFDTKKIIHVAQIAEAKRQKDIIEAFIPLATEYPDWKIEFYGKVKNSTRHKKYMQTLQNIVKQHNLEQQILFPGFSHNITENYLNSEIVVLPSHTEGFGYGLADGLAIGLPGIGYNFAYAINRIIIDQKSGYLVSDINDLTDKLRTLMSNKDLRKNMGIYARQDMERYSPQSVISSWLDLIDKTTGEQK